MKLKHTETKANNTVKVYWLSDVEEYVCKLFTNNKHRPRCDYFTNDKEDAIATAKQMVDYK